MEPAVQINKRREIAPVLSFDYDIVVFEVKKKNYYHRIIKPQIPTTWIAAKQKEVDYNLALRSHVISTSVLYNKKKSIGRKREFSFVSFLVKQ